MTMNRYEMDPKKQRTKTATQVGRPHDNGRHRHGGIKSTLRT